MTKIISSAQKLHEILEQAYEQNIPDPNSTPASQVWAEVLNANPQNISDIVEKFSELIQLIGDVKDDIKKLEERNHQKYLKTISKIQDILLLNNPLQGSWSSIKNSLNEDLLSFLAMCGELLETRNKGAKEITPEELDILRKQINDLIDNIVKSDIDSETKNFLIEKLHELEQVILKCQIRGTTLVKKVNNQIFGEIITFIAENCLKLSNNSKETIKQVLEFSAKLNGALSLGEKIPHLVEGIKHLLSLSPGGN